MNECYICICTRVVGFFPVKLSGDTIYGFKKVSQDKQLFSVEAILTLVMEQCRL